MKTIQFIFLLSLVSILFIACDDDATPEPSLTNSEVLGQWLLTEQYISPGGPTTWQTVTDGYIVSFNDDLTFTDFENCTSGTYTINGDTLAVDCVGTITDYSMEFESDDIMILSNILCIEPCMFKYQKQ